MVRKTIYIFAMTMSLWTAGAVPLTGAEPASPIQPAEDGVFTLPASAAALSGKSVRLNDEIDSLDHWLANQDRANWQVKNAKMGDFDVAVTWNVAEKDAPQAYNIPIDHKSTIRALTVSTGGKFRRDIVGRIMLAPGVRDVTFFPAGNVRGRLCQLKQIELIPVANLAVATPQEPVELHVPEGFEAFR
jgi:hypothetical protein